MNVKSIELASGGSVTSDRLEIEINPITGLQNDYIVLSKEERAKGFVRPVRQSYVHSGIEPLFDGDILMKMGKGGCGVLTTMGIAIAETYASDPKFYSGTFCVGCKAHFTLNEFTWDGTKDIVGS